MNAYPLLDKIKAPHDLQQFTIEELSALALEVRRRIIEVLSGSGGHLSSNLGIVELTIALHYVFSSPVDKLLFDTSHQTYTHKLVTGRHKHFETLRKYRGLCGFSCPPESEHDHFFAGHAGNALSVALGLVASRDAAGRKEHIIPILGDASFTCGLIYEALNNISRNQKRLVILLNDNEMAISKNVGNIQNILSRLVNSPISNKMYQEIETILAKLPACGRFLASQGHKITGSIKNLVSPAPFFEQFNLSYVGPIDGHDLSQLIHTFSALKNTEGPVLVHVFTKKGLGLSAASDNPTPYHGAKPFDAQTGLFLPSKAITFPKIFGKTLCDMAANDKNIIAISPAMIEGSGLSEFKKLFPERCHDVGIAEGHALTFAGSIAKDPHSKVALAIYSTFLQRALDNFFHDICLQNAPVVIGIDRAGLSGPDGCTHHGIYDIAFLNCMPNAIICQPRNGNMLKRLLKSAFGWKKPTAIRYPNLATDEEGANTSMIEPGCGEILSQGSDLLLLPLGHIYKTAMAVKNILLTQKINATIVDPVFIKPLDEKLLLELLQTHSHIVTIEEHALASGFGAIFNNFIIKHRLSHLKILNLGLPDQFIQHGANDLLLAEAGLDAPAIVSTILKEFYYEKAEEASHAHSSLSQ